MRSSEAGLFLAVALVSAALVGLVRALAVSHGMIQHPTHRGSHDIPTPRGGGLGVVIAIVGAFMILQTASSDPFVLACVAAGVAVAVVGWLDDRGGLSVRARLIVHVLAGITVGALAVRDTSPAIVTVALFGWWAFWTVSSINLVNFMDGINGLVASQVAIFGASLMLFSWQDATSSWYAAAIAAGCVGFLPWNFPRARIFLGDVGSGALGFLVPFIAILVMLETGIDVVSAHLPLLPLFGDATVTIIRRWRLGEKLTAPHRSHLYQRLANGGFGHTRVTLLYACASVGGAIVAHRGGRSLGWLLVVFYVALLGLLSLLLERRLRLAKS